MNYYFKTSKNINYKQSYLVLIIGLIAGFIGWKLYGNPNAAISGDSEYYFRTAKLIKESIHNLFLSPQIGVTESINAIVLGILIKLPFNDISEIFVFQILLFAFSGLFIFWFSNACLNNNIGAWIVFLFYVLNNKHWQHIYLLKPGVWVVFWMSLILLYGYKLYKNPQSLSLLIKYATLLGVMILTDMRYIPHLACLSFCIFLPWKKMSKSIGRMTAILGIIILIITPWCFREYLVFNRFIFISDVNTMVLQQKIAPEKFKNTWIYLGEKRRQDSLWLPDGRNLQHEALIQQGKLTRAQVNEIVDKEEHKPSWLKRLEYGLELWAPYKFRYSYEPLETFKVISPPASKANNLNRILTVGLLYPFFLIGLIVIIKRKDWYGWGLIGMLLFHFALHTFTYASWRYLLPVLPIITLIAALGCITILNKICNHEIKQ
jgi:hypothetical protein